MVKETKKETKKIKKKKEVKEGIKPHIATGRRKEAVARVYLRPGSGKIFINGKRLEVYFTREDHQKIVKAPLVVTKAEEKFDIKTRIAGGGISGQAGAIRLGIARALGNVNEHDKDILKKSGFFTRDPRAKERKKYGKKGARRSFQFSKR